MTEIKRDKVIQRLKRLNRKKGLRGWNRKKHGEKIERRK